MSYALSQIDKDNFQWFNHDRSRNSLVEIKVTNGNIRGVFPYEVEFTYPITAFVGENGSGKSTMLALSACAFHNGDDFHQFARKKSYFTYGDFFTFSSEEHGLQGIEISYTVRQPNGDVVNIRRKKPSGKWNDFNTRKYRNVIYLGINRIIPPSESSVHRSYRKDFEATPVSEDILSRIKSMASRIFGKNYSDLKIFTHNMYRLFLVERNQIYYSGFNMGAGENAAISILLDLLSAGPGALMVIDEIELGLHAKAQKEFIVVLKEICKSQKCQIICSTHSSVVLANLPPEARCFIQNQNTRTIITPKVSVEYAFGKLAGQNTHELNVFVEDDVGEAIIRNIIPLSLRERLSIYVIGSDEAVLKQMAAHYREGRQNFITFLDGDKRLAHEQQIDRIKRHLETRINDDEERFHDIISQRLCYIPGETWPEISIITFLLRTDVSDSLSSRWDISKEEIASYFEQALTAGKHNEFYHLAKLLSMDELSIRNDCIKEFKALYPEECSVVCSQIECVLNTL